MRVEELDSGQKPSAEQLGRSSATDAEALEAATRIIADVRERGDEALREYSLEFDKVTPKYFRLSDEDRMRAARQVPKRLLEALQLAAANIRSFHERQVQQSWFVTRPDGALLGSRVTPLASVGIYVPGGRASYPSTVLMNAIPAQVAGVQRIAIATPPRPDGSVDPLVLAAAQLAGVTDVYAVGGAQAIAALAYGTESIGAVDKITGPGNAYVAAAKRLVFGDVGIDMVAGPSEVLILADDSSDPSLIAIDLLAQAEHDPQAATYLVTTDEDLVDEVIEEVERYLGQSPRQEITKQSLDANCLVLVCPDLATALLAANTIAPEHLEIHMDQPLELLGLIENAGAVFCGPWTPESVGDYIAGPNHTLPTGGTARFSSPLSVEDFIKRTSVLSYSYGALQKDSAAIRALAEAEGLWAHGKAVDVRFETGDER
ncbi:MAG: histidinol dehydrogenase [Coriobacteriales bacterium]|jgi:histidinol dehydrogenase|nr:histidinol dehydrogenase [Coriobacteriales bacterium]